eukprot:TRINITY_DN2707_c0_g1_i4.p2 TRINITY_DN2707_c0_g1~~TRINITY_DN2707_c0_g1_i4.p2  ORF type:complete len:104 (-),score=15.25 TRINITY_DN2707_c0_g1_i4:257-532(-)
MMSSGQTLGVKAQRFRGHTSPHRNVKEKKKKNVTKYELYFYLYINIFISLRRASVIINYVVLCCELFHFPQCSKDPQARNNPNSPAEVNVV